ncbi:MAG: recombinase family protein, partial [Clostridia bacterium]|nr:recombinase family protein [Clostridia bacterium]
LLNTFSAMAQEESVSISQNLRFGVKKRMEDGTYINGSEPYGYRFEDKKLVPYEPEASVVRDIFRMYLGGMSTLQIAKQLESNGVLTKAGNNKWYHRYIASILGNEKYVGDSLYQKSYCDTSVPFTKHINRGQQDKYYACGTHDSIIARELFEAAQQLQNAQCNKYAHTGPKRKYTFTSHIRCKECGSFYQRKARNNSVLWVCPQHLADKEKCNSAYCKEEYIKNAFVKMVNKLIFAEPNILDESLRLLEYAMALQKKGNVEALGVSQSIAELNAKLLMLEQLRGKGYLATEVYETQAREIKAQINKKKNERAELLESGYEKIFDELKTLKRILSIETPLDCFDEKLFESGVKEVVIDSQKKITFTLLGNLEFSGIIKD